jgi:hypothetical protein
MNYDAGKKRGRKRSKVFLVSLRATEKIHYARETMPQPPFSTGSRVAPHSPLPPEGIPTEVCAAPTPVPALLLRAKKRFGVAVFSNVALRKWRIFSKHAVNG